MASTFNAFELLQGNGSATSSKKKKSKKKVQAEASAPPQSSAADAPPSTATQAAPTNGIKSKQDTYGAEISALSAPVGKQRSEAWAAWATKVRGCL